MAKKQSGKAKSRVPETGLRPSMTGCIQVGLDKN